MRPTRPFGSIRYCKGLSTPALRHQRTRRFQPIVHCRAGRRIKVLAPGATTPTVFLDITSRSALRRRAGSAGARFSSAIRRTNSRFFVNYTRQADGATVIAEYHASADPNVTAASETILLVIAQPYANHNGGMIEFGRDGYLYIGMGDGGAANDPGSRCSEHQ